MKKHLPPFLGVAIILGAFITTGFTHVDVPFLNKASAANLAEIAAGKLAIEKGGSKVKKMAKKMVTDHGKAETELKQIAVKENITVDSLPDAVHQQALADMTSLSGTSFDSAYMASQLKDHQDAVVLFSSESTDGTDALTKAYAAKYLPKLKMHLQMFQGNSRMVNQ